MSRNELIDAYRRGRISRRRFVQGMTALGIAGGVAAKMADDLRASPGNRGARSNLAAQATATDDVYTPTATTTATATATAAATTTPTTSLPSTGVGDPGSSSSLWKPVAVAGAAAAAFVAAKLRKIRGAETE